MLREGGNTFSEVEPIRGDLAKIVTMEIITKLKREFGEDMRIEPQGSTMRNRPNQYCGDIDILMDMPYNKTDDNSPLEEMDAIEDFIAKECPNSEIKRQTGTLKNIISFEYPYDEDGVQKKVQVDLKITNNFDWTNNMGHSLIKTSFKDALRKILLKVCASVAPYQGDDPDSHQNEFFTVDDFRGKNGEDGKYAGELKSEWRYTMDDNEGMYFARRPREGKRQPQFRTWARYNRQLPRFGSYDTKEFVTDKFSRALKIIFGPLVRPYNVASVEGIIRFLYSGKYAYASEENLKHIKEQVEFELDRSNRGLGDDIVQRFDAMWAKYSGEEPEIQLSQEDMEDEPVQNTEESLPIMECSNFALSMRDIMRRMSVL